MKKICRGIVLAFLLLSAACGKPAPQPTEPSPIPSAPSASESPAREPAAAWNPAIYAAAASNPSFLPREIAEPVGEEWAAEADAEAAGELLRGLDPAAYTELWVICQPEEERSCTDLSEESAEKIFGLLKELRPAACEPKNPATGGSVSIYLFGEGQAVKLSYPGEFFTVWQEGAPAAHIFDAAACQDIFHEIRELAETALEAAR